MSALEAKKPSKAKPKGLASNAIVLPYATPPGDTLRETLKAKGISQTLLAETMRRPIKTINEIIHAKARITEHTALELEHALGIPAHVWMSLESNYRIALARLNARGEGPPRCGSNSPSDVTGGSSPPTC